MLSVKCIAGSWNPISKLAGVVIMFIGSSSASIPLFHFTILPKASGTEQLKISVKVPPSHESATVFIFPPMASINSALEARA